MSFAEQFDVMGSCNQESLCGQWTFLVKIKKTFMFLAPITRGGGWSGQGGIPPLCGVAAIQTYKPPLHTVPLQRPGEEDSADCDKMAGFVLFLCVCVCV